MRVRNAWPIRSSPCRGCVRNARAALHPDFRTGAYYNAHGRLSATARSLAPQGAHAARSSRMELSLQMVHTRYPAPGSRTEISLQIVRTRAAEAVTRMEGELQRAQDTHPATV